MTEYSPNNTDSGSPSGNQERLLGWSAMLAKWTEFAQAAVALPSDSDGPSWKASVSPIITMQALVAALGELDQFPRSHRPVAIDAGEALLREQLSLIHEAWSGELIPDSLQELIEDSRRAVYEARHRGMEWRVIEERISAPDLRTLAKTLIESGFRGDLHAARAGTALFCGAPLAFFRPALSVNPPEGCGCVEVVGPRQCYRQVDESDGAPIRDVVAGPESPLQPGRPLLFPLIVDGVLTGQPEWPEACAVARPLPVVELD